MGTKRFRKGRAQRVFRARKLFCMILTIWVQVIIYLAKPIGHTTPRAKLKIKYGLWVVMTCQCRRIDCNTYTTLVGDVDSGGSYAWGRECMENSLDSLLRFAVNLKVL